jgi:ataxia telangiectasia mutated family protein
MKIADARKQLSEYQKSPASERVETYKDIMKRVKPVMRHFFMEKHYIPERWFEMRLLYSRSVAVMSMVGHILGLGDRHVSNIMIDTAKGELVPIDLGIAFEAVSLP